MKSDGLTWYAASPAGVGGRQEYRASILPAARALQPCPREVLPSVEEVLRLVEGDEDAGLGVGCCGGDGLNRPAHVVVPGAKMPPVETREVAFERRA